MLAAEGRGGSPTSVVGGRVSRPLAMRSQRLWSFCGRRRSIGLRARTASSKPETALRSSLRKRRTRAVAGRKTLPVPP